MRSDHFDDEPVAELLERDLGERGKDRVVVVFDRRSRLSGVRRRANGAVAAGDVERALDRRIIFTGAPSPRFDGRKRLGHTHAIGLSCSAIVLDALKRGFARRWARGIERLTIDSEDRDSADLIMKYASLVHPRNSGDVTMASRHER